MKKVALETCFIDNYGACLQAYSLQCAIKKNGFDCYIINYDHSDLITNSSNKESRKNIINRFFKIFNPVNIYCYFLRKKSSYLRHQSFESFRNTFLSFTNVINTESELVDLNNSFDIFVCGSDQIWNPMLAHFRNLKVELLLFADSKKTIVSYAPSIGVNKIPDNLVNLYSFGLKRFSRISVREDISVELIKKQFNLNCVQVLDPVFLTSKDEWIEMTKMSQKKTSNKRYIFCYFFGRSKNIIKRIKEIQKMTKLDVVIIPYEKRDFLSCFQKDLDSGPLDFVKLINDAELILTDSFHATSFSIILNKPFFVYERMKKEAQNSQNSRIYSILKMFNLESRLLDVEKETKSSININISYDTINPIINKKVGFSIDYLKTALKGKVQ